MQVDPTALLCRSASSRGLTARLGPWFEWLFTPQCPACGVPSNGMCEPCCGALVELGSACPRCSAPRESRELAKPTELCHRCARHPLLVEHIAAPWRFGGSLATAIRRLKFSGHTHVARSLAPLWAPLLAAAVVAGSTGGTAAVVVPIPLHWRRRLVRGFDQAWLLAVHACDAACVPPPVAALRRIHHAPPQSTLSASERMRNLVDAFAVTKPALVVGRVVVLVDDVVTTGATLAAAAAPLLAAGACRVLGIALARS